MSSPLGLLLGLDGLVGGLLLLGVGGELGLVLGNLVLLGGGLPLVEGSKVSGTLESFGSQ